MMVLDTNAWLVYYMYFPVRPSGDGLPVRVTYHNREAVAVTVDRGVESGDIAIPDTVAAEMHDSTEKAFNSAARRAVAAAKPGDGVVDDALARFDLLHRLFGVRDNLSYLEAIDLMYADIWRNPRMADAVARWRRVKRRHGWGEGRPSLGMHRADFVILSTAAGLAAQGHQVKLLTLDRDLVEFAAAIRERFGVHVVDCGRM